MVVFSIIVYYFNNNNLTEILVNILNINYNNIEIILIDDNSNNINSEFLNNSKLMNKIKFIKNNYHRGIFNSINQCISLCTGDYIMISTCDIRYDKNIINYLLPYIDTNDVIEFKSDNNYIYDFVFYCFSKKIFKSIGYFDTYDKYSDWDFKYRINKLFKIKKLDLILINLEVLRKVDITDSIKFKKYFSDLTQRLYVNDKNNVKYNSDLFHYNIYSNCDVILDEKNVDNLKCIQFYKIYDKSKYRMINIEDKYNIQIRNSKGKSIILQTSLFLDIDTYRLDYSINGKVDKINTILFITAI